MSKPDTGRIGPPSGVTLVNQQVRDELAQADHLDAGGALPGTISQQIESSFVAVVDQHGLLHPVSMQIMIHLVNRWVGYRESIGVSLLHDVLSRIKMVLRGDHGNSRFNDNVCNVLLRLSESCARAGFPEEGLQFMALNEILVESWQGSDHPDCAGAIYNQGRYLRMLGRNSEARADFERALAVKGPGDFTEIQNHVRQSLERLTEGSSFHEFSDPEMLRPWLCLLESSLVSQRREAAKRILEICRENRQLFLRRDHEGIGKARADSDPDVWQPLSLARLYLGDSQAHFDAAMVLERQRFDPDDSVRDQAMGFLSRIPGGRITGDLFDGVSVHFSDALRSDDPEIAFHAGRYLFECAGWQEFPPPVVETVSKVLGSGSEKMRSVMMGILYNAAQYAETDLTPAVSELEIAHIHQPGLRPRPGRTLCRHHERISGEKYIQDPEVDLELPSHWRVEQTRLPLYGILGEEVVNGFEEVRWCGHCGDDRPSCIHSSGNGDPVCEFYCAKCDRYTNYRFHRDSSHY